MLTLFASPGAAAAGQVSDNLRNALEDKGFTTNAVSQARAEASRVRILFGGTPPDGARAAIERTGAEIVDWFPDMARATVSVTDLGMVEAIADVQGVEGVERSLPAVTHSLGDGVADHRAEAALGHQWVQRGMPRGEDVRVGVISGSFASTDDVVDSSTSGTQSASSSGTTVLRGSNPQESGDLPEEVMLVDDSGAGVDEGAAMAEIIHEFAPEAEIYFHRASGGEGVFANAYEDLCRTTDNGGAGVDIVVDDIGYFGELGYQPDVVQDAISTCEQNGVAVFAAHGNAGDNGFRATFKDHEQATDTDGSVPSPRDADFHEWQSKSSDPEFLEVTVPADSSATIALFWNQPSGQSIPASNRYPEIDLDLRIYSAPNATKGNLVRASVRDQEAGNPSSGFDAFEAASTGVVSSERTFYVAVERWAGNEDVIPQDGATPLEFRLVVSGGAAVTVENVTTSYSPAPASWGHVRDPAVMSIGAVHWHETNMFQPGALDSSGTDAASFTSRGGTHPQQFAYDGTLQKTSSTTPTAAAVDGLNTTFFGVDPKVNADDEVDDWPNFYGTSAAAPVMAGLAAFWKGLVPDLDPGQIRTIIEKGAEPIDGNRGGSRYVGAGLYKADNGARALLPWAKIGPDRVVGSDDFGVNVETVGGTKPYTARWRQIDGPAQLEFSDKTALSPDVVAPEDGTYRLQLTLTESSGITSRSVTRASSGGATSTTEHEVVVESDVDSGGSDGSSSGGGGGGGALLWLSLSLAGLITARRRLALGRAVGMAALVFAATTGCAANGGPGETGTAMVTDCVADIAAEAEAGDNWAEASAAAPTQHEGRAVFEVRGDVTEASETRYRDIRGLEVVDYTPGAGRFTATLGGRDALRRLRATRGIEAVLCLESHVQR